jgi:molecular chaperone DnaJ
MDHNKAYSLLGVTEKSTEEDLKQAFKTKGLQYHPDRNKDPKAESQFKEINTAYQFLKTNGIKARPQQNNFNGFNPFDGMPFNPFTGFPFNANFHNHVQQVPQEIVMQIELTVIECMNGCEKQLTFNKKIACEKCKGQGYETSNHACPNCQGKKFRTVKLPDGEKELPCSSCRGTGFVVRRDKKCNCLDGCVINKVTEQINIPPGASFNSRMRLSGVGNYSIIGGYGDIVIEVSRVIPYNGIELIDEVNVSSTIDVSLMDALKGKYVEVETLIGKKTLKIPPKTRHKDQLRAVGAGLRNKGNHYFNINVNYPDDINTLISYLESKNVKPVEQTELTEPVGQN